MLIVFVVGEVIVSFQDTFACKKIRGDMGIQANTAAWWLFSKTTSGWNNMNLAQ